MSISWINRHVMGGYRKWVPGPVRSAGRSLLVKTGLVDERAMEFGLKKMYPDDTFVCSYPKSGNTWVRFLVANLKNKKEKITFRNIEEKVPTVKRSKGKMEKLDRPRFMKTHRPLYKKFPRFVYIFRDVRDVAVSYYHYSMEYGWYQGELRGFIRGKWPWHGSFGSWSEHVEGAFDYAEEHPDDVLLLCYEDMLEDPVPSVRRLARFCQIDASEEDLHAAIEACDFEKLKKNEEKHGSESTEKNMTFFRSGSKRQWEDRLSEEDLDYLIERAGSTLRRTGYL